MPKVLTPNEIIDDMVAYYNEDPTRRAHRIDDNGMNSCEYYFRQGRIVKKCAVGRCLYPKVAKALAQDPYDHAAGFDDIIDASITWEDFQPKYRFESTRFWYLLQELHDTCKYWDEDGITSAGRARVAELKGKPEGYWEEDGFDEY